MTWRAPSTSPCKRATRGSRALAPRALGHAEQDSGAAIGAWDAAALALLMMSCGRAVRMTLVPGLYSVLDVVLRWNLVIWPKVICVSVIWPKVRRYYKFRSVLLSRPGTRNGRPRVDRALFQRLSLTYDELHSDIDFKCNLRLYSAARRCARSPGGR